MDKKDSDAAVLRAVGGASYIEEAQDALVASHVEALGKSEALKMLGDACWRRGRALGCAMELHERGATVEHVIRSARLIEDYLFGGEFDRPKAD